jgi:hypothetical protein
MQGKPPEMNRQLYALERRRQRGRDLKAAPGLAIWAPAAGCPISPGMRTVWSETYADAIGTALYLVTFFYRFAFWPVHAAVERLFRALPQAPQEGASPISAASSSAVTARNEAGGASSPGAGS